MRKTLLFWIIPVITAAAAVAGYALTRSSDSPKGGGGTTGPTAGPTFTITASSPLPQLWPGRTQTVPVTITSAGPSIDVLSLGGSAADVPGCPGSVVSVVATSSFPINVPQGGS